jgi:hypothetical protein
MTIYNTTFCVDNSLEFDIIKWIKETYAPQALDSGKFESHMLVRVAHEYEPGVSNYALHLQTSQRDVAEDWFAGEGQALLDKLHAICGDKAMWFRTELEVI